jgi:fucose permease
MVMAIVGGAVFPPLMGLIADKYGMPAGFLAPSPSLPLSYGTDLKDINLPDN